MMHNMNNLRPQMRVCEAHLHKACKTLWVISEKKMAKKHDMGSHGSGDHYHTLVLK